MNNQKKIQMTREGLENLKKEYQELRTVKRQAAVDALQKARSMGDLSENTAYSSAREALALVEGRIQEIEEILKSVEVVENGASNGQLTLGSTVSVQSNNNQEQFQIVGEFEADPINKKISATSPLGRGLIGKKVGEMVEITAPAGKIQYQIVEIK